MTPPNRPPCQAGSRLLILRRLVGVVSRLGSPLRSIFGVIDFSACRRIHRLARGGRCFLGMLVSVVELRLQVAVFGFQLFYPLLELGAGRVLFRATCNCRAG